MITKTALAEKFKAATLAFAKTRSGLAPNAAPYHKDVMVELTWPLLAAAWDEGNREGADGIGRRHNPYLDA